MHNALRTATHIMVDLETMGLGINPVVMSIGAVEFTLSGEILRKFRIGIDKLSAVESGLFLDPKTVQWWSEQTPEAQEALRKSQVGAATLREGMKAFMDWLPQGKEFRLWGNGLLADNVWLASACKAAGLYPEWEKLASYKRHTDYRTFMETMEYVNGGTDWRFKFPMKGTLHDPVDDAIFQVQCVAAATKEFRL